MYSPEQFLKFLRCTKALALSVEKGRAPKRPVPDMIRRISKQQAVTAYIRQTGIHKVGPAVRRARPSELRSNKDFLVAVGHVKLRKLSLDFDLIRYQKGQVTAYYFNLDCERQFPALDQDIIGFEYSLWILSLLTKVTRIVLVNQRPGEVNRPVFFYAEDITERVEYHIRNKIRPIYLSAKKNLKNKQDIHFHFGAHCGLFTEQQCQFLETCHNVNKSDHILSYKGVFTRHRFGLLNRRIETLERIPLSLAYKKHELIIQNCAESGEDFIDRTAIRKWLKSKNHDLRVGQIDIPLMFMDFEAYDFEYPLDPKWDTAFKVPFQFSLQIIYPGKETPDEREYLDIGEGIPHLQFISKLLDYCEGPIKAGARTLVYNKSFEIGVLQGLQKQFPKRGNEIQALIDSIVDLMTPFRKRSFYSPDQKGGYGLKAVYPAIRKYVPKSKRIAVYSYSGLNVDSGLSAVLNYALLQNKYRQTEPNTWQNQVRNRIIKDLREYCRLDTLSMCEALYALNDMVQES